jgi:hypothetical protein
MESTVFVVNNLQRALETQTFQELWRTLTDDQVFELRKCFEAAIGRELDAFFKDATAEDWEAMKTLLENLKTAALELNAVIRDRKLDWTNTRQVEAATNEACQMAAGRAPEYVALMDHLADQLRFYSDGLMSDFGPYHLFDMKVIAAPPVVDESPHDIFVSYETSRHAEQATDLVRRLRELGYRVWFDVNVLNQMQNRPKLFETEHLISILTRAVHRSRCTIIFEGELRDVQLPPGVTKEETLSRRTTMTTPQGNFVAFSWQGLEISETACGITIHPTTVAAFRIEGGRAMWTRSFDYGTDRELLTAITSALALFEIHPAGGAAQSGTA